MKCRCGTEISSKMPDSITCTVCGEGDKAICYECRCEDFYKFGICASCGVSSAENDCGGYYLCNTCVAELDDFWDNDDDDDEEEPKNKTTLKINGVETGS